MADDPIDLAARHDQKTRAASRPAEFDAEAARAWAEFEALADRMADEWVVRGLQAAWITKFSGVTVASQDPLGVWQIRFAGIREVG
jgi:hypothetical protein